MSMDTAWPDNILPALKRRLAAEDRSAMVGLHPRIVEGLRQLAAEEHSRRESAAGVGQAQRLVALCEQWTVRTEAEPDAVCDAGPIYAVIVPVGDALTILDTPED